MTRYLRELVQGLTYGGGTMLVALVVAMAIQTVQSLYQGPGIDVSGRRTYGNADVGDCHRMGPISPAGFGYWWACHAELEMVDGRTLSIEAGLGMFSPSDRGQNVKVIEICTTNDVGECRYSRPASPILGVSVIILDLIKRCIVVLGLGLGGVVLIGGLIGGRGVRTLMVTSRFRKRASVGETPSYSDVSLFKITLMIAGLIVIIVLMASLLL